MKWKLLTPLCFLIPCGYFVLGAVAQNWHDEWGAPITLTYNSGTTQKLEQITADCDWAIWDATAMLNAKGKVTNPDPQCKPTVSQTAARADVLGQGLGYSFEHEGKLIFLFGDTFGALNGNCTSPTGMPISCTDYSPWTKVVNNYQYQAGDTMAWSNTQHGEDGLLLNYFMSSDQSHALVVQPEYQVSHCYPDLTCGTALPMGADNIPNSGISLDGQIYIVASTGTLNQDYSTDYAVLAKFDERSGTFAAGRTISSVPNGGHFVYQALREFPWNEGWGRDSDDGLVVIAGLGQYRKSNIYLSIIPKRGFESGAGALYFTGLDAYGLPTWSTNDDSSAVPIVTDLDPAKPTIGNLSLIYSRELGLWLMTFDGGRAENATTGVYFSYAEQPWGPWSKPQFIFGDCQDHGYADFIFYYAASASQNGCPTALPPGPVSYPASAGPIGPTGGPQDPAGNDPISTRGGGFAPQMIERFTQVEGDRLKIYYTLSTWNPYAVLKMESDFTISRNPWWGWD